MYQPSKYNYFVPYHDRIIYFNGLSGYIFSATEKEHLFLQEQFDDSISFQIHYNSIFQKFKEWGFITDKDKDEKDIIRLRNRKAVFSDKFYRMVVNPTLDCNFNCWYCYEEHPKGRMSEETMDLVKKHIQWMADREKIPGMMLDWFGGEPLMYFNQVMYPIAVFAKELMERNNLRFQHHVTTNAYLITAAMIKKFQEIELDSFQITIDGDEKRHDKIRNANGLPSFKRIMNNIVSLCEEISQVHITLRVNYDAETLDESDMESVFGFIPVEHRSKIAINFQRVWQTASKKMDENERLISLHKTTTNMGFKPCSIGIFFSVNSNYTCYVDRLYHTEINYDGKVYRCTARTYTDEHVKGILKEDGHIEWFPDKMAEMYGKATFENEMCINCKHLPICNGPCVQKIIETKTENLHRLCALNNSEISPETFIVKEYERKMNYLQKTQVSVP